MFIITAGYQYLEMVFSISTVSLSCSLFLQINHSAHWYGPTEELFNGTYEYQV